MFGEEALVVNLATTATAIAEGSVSCVGMDRATFTEVRIQTFLRDSGDNAKGRSEQYPGRLVSITFLAVRFRHVGKSESYEDSDEGCYSTGRKQRLKATV